LGGWITLSLIPFVDIVASVRDLVGALVNGDWVGAGLEVIFGVLGFLAPIAGDIPGTAGKVIKFLVRAPEKAGAVLKFLIKNASGRLDDVLRPLVKQIWGITDEQIARVGGMTKVVELGDEFVNTKKLGEWLARNADNAITKASVNSDQVLDSVRRNWDEAADDAASQRIRNLAAEAVSTEAAVKILESRGYSVLYVSRNVPFDVGDDVRRSIVNGPDIIARSPGGRPVIVEVKGSNQAKFRIGESTITTSAGVQTSRDWLLDASGTRYRNTLEQAAAIDQTGRLERAREAIEEIIDGGDYDVIIAGAAEQTVFSGGLENALLKLDNGGATEVLEIDVPRSLLDDAIAALTP
jgi:Holliday junction resolvase-like predicted endonuclease